MKEINIMCEGFKLKKFGITFKTKVLQLPCDLSSSFELFDMKLAFIVLVAPFPISQRYCYTHFD